MAEFTNFATLSYKGGTLRSNTVTGEILETVSVEKTAVSGSYGAGDTLSYAVSLVNSGPAEAAGLTLTDDLGAYELDGVTLYPLSYVDGTAHLFVNGVLQPAPAVTAGPPLVFSEISIPAGPRSQNTRLSRRARRSPTRSRPRAAASTRAPARRFPLRMPPC